MSDGRVSVVVVRTGVAWLVEWVLETDLTNQTFLTFFTTEVYVPVFMFRILSVS